MITSEWVDLDPTRNQIAYALQPDFTWKRYEGKRFLLHSVEFEGTPEEISDKIQSLRDSVEWDELHHMHIRHAALGFIGKPGQIRFYLRAYLANDPYLTYGPLLDVKRTMLRIMAHDLLFIHHEGGQILVSLLEKYTNAVAWNIEDEHFLNLIENIIKAMRSEKNK